MGAAAAGAWCDGVAPAGDLQVAAGPNLIQCISQGRVMYNTYITFHKEAWVRPFFGHFGQLLLTQT